MNVPSGFKTYQSKPIQRFAYEVKSKDQIHAISETEYVINVEGEVIQFKAHETIFPGDYVVFLSDNDCYHCRQAVFKERNFTS